MSYWLDEPRLHDANLYIPSLPPQYEKDHLMKIFQCNPALWNHFLDRKMVEAEITKLATHWKEYFLPKVQHKKPVDENKAPSVKILNRLHSYDMHLPPPSVENIISPIAELPHTLIGDKYNLIHSLRADFESLQGYAKCYDERIQKHVALNCSLLELLPELFKPVNIESTVSISCKSMINPLHKCKGAAAANVSYEGTTRDNVISRKINENRAEYKQVLIESILTPSQHLCSSAVHVETSITELLKLYKETNDIKRKEELQDVGCTLFYNVAAYVCDITKYYPPTRQFFSFCLEVLGQEFIRNNPSQAQPLLQTILQNPILVNIMSSSFSPNASPELFTTMYEDLILVPTNQGSDVAITLLTKFGINEWMQNTLVGMPQRQDLLHLIGRALCQCGQRPSKQVKAVCEVYKNHLIDVYEFQFPELYKDILEVLLSGSSSGHLLVEVWEDFVQSLFSDSTAERLSSNQINYNSGENLLANKSRIYQLTFVQITQTLSILQVHFNQLRLGTLSSHGLYPRWRAYIEPLTIFMGVLCRLLIQWNVKWIKIGELKYEKENESSPSTSTGSLPSISNSSLPRNGDVFQMLKSVIRPWVEVYIHDTHLAPWLPADMEPASLMVRMWITCITLLHAEMKGLEQCTSITSTDVTPLSLLMSWYVECMHKVDVPCHVLSVIHKYVSDLPWKEFLPSLQDLQNFNLVLQSDKEQSIDFLKLVVCQIPWGSYYRDVAVLLHNDFPTHVSFHVQLFHLFVILPARTEYKDEILNDFFTKIEKCQWDIVDAKSFQHTAETYVHYSDPKTLLGKRTHPSMMSLKLLRRGCSFLPMPENVILHPETPVKMVFYVKSIVELLCKCCADNNVMDDSLKIVMNNLLTDVETVVSSVIDASGQSQCGLMLCMEVVNVLNICQVEKSLLLLNTIMEWIDHSPTSILLHSMISSTCRNLVHIPHMVQLTEICIDNHFTGDPKDSSWAMVLSSLQVPELELDVFLKGAIVSGSFLTLYAHVLQQLPFSQSPDEELQQLKKLIAWNQEVKLNMQNEHKILTWWWQILKLCERQIQYNGPLDKLGEILNSFVSLLWSFGEDKDSSGFFGAIGLGKKSTLSLQFRVLSKCMSTYIAAQVTQNNVPRILATDSVILKKAGSPHDNKNVQHHVKATRQCMSHISGLTVGNKQYIEYKTQLEYAVDFMCNADNTILQASKLLFYFVHQLYSDKACLCDILQSHI